MKSVRVSGYYCEKDMFHELHKSFLKTKGGRVCVVYPLIKCNTLIFVHVLSLYMYLLYTIICI